MSGPLVIVDVTRNLGIAFMAVSWPFVVFDSLSKTVDIVDMKSKLDLCEARYVAIVVRVMESSLAPLVGTDLRSVDADFDFDPSDDEIVIPAPDNLSDTAKNALVVALRRCDKILADIYTIRHLPERVGKLNRRIYGCTVTVAIVATLMTGCCFLWPEMPHGVAWSLLVSLLITFLITGYFATNRQRQVHDAAQAIVDEDPQPRV